MKELLKRGSLGSRVFLALILGELAFALVLGVTIGVFVTLADVHQREEAIRQISSTIGAGLMPMIADQQLNHVQAQLSSILETANVHDVIGICIRDASGSEIACEGAIDATAAAEPERNRFGPLSVVLEEQLSVQPIVVDGLQVATVSVLFAPAGMGALTIPAIASIAVLLSVITVSLPWTAWWLTREIVEPLDELGDYATQIASGDPEASPLRTRSGEIGDLQATLSSVSQQIKDRDERLRGSLRDLEEAYVSLERAKNEIEQLSEVKSNFVAVAAHEIRGPLATVSLFAELLESGEMGVLAPRVQEATSAIRSASARLTSIVSSLMDSALLERGLLPISLARMPFAPVLSEAVSDSQLMARKRDITVTFDGEVPPLILRGDPVRLRQVMDNLLSNALKYSPQGSVVTVRVRADEEWAEIDVVDEGRGIPKSSRGRLFALFGRVDFGDSRDTDGLGLGLAISARIVEAHGGQISCHTNRSGKGSVFRVRLPLGGTDDGPADTTIRVANGEVDT